MSLMLPFEHRFKDDGGEGIDKARAQRPQPIVYMTGAVLVAILAVTPWLGTFLAMVVAAVVIPLLWGERRYGILTAFAIGLPLIVLFVFRSDERRVGKEWVSQCRCRGSPYH